MFSQFSSQFDVAVKNMAKMAADQTTKCQNHYKREFSNIGKCFTGLGQAMEMDGGGYNPGLNRAVVATGECYEEVGRLYEEQPRLDWEHVADMMHDYKGLLAGWPQVLQIHSVSLKTDVSIIYPLSCYVACDYISLERDPNYHELNIYQGATGKRKEIEAGGSDSSQAKKRSDTVSYALLAGGTAMFGIL